MPFILPFLDSKWDFRPDEYSVYNWFVNPQLHKKAIKEGEEPPRDYLLNLYFGKPDYEDVHKKLYYSSYMGAKAAAFFAVMGIASAGTKSPKVALAVTAKCFAFIGGGALVYGTTAATVSNLRGKKDDLLNHFIAGASVGFISGYYRKSSAAGCLGGAFFGLAGMAMKKWHQSDRHFLIKQGQRSITIDGNQSLDFRIYSPALQQWHKEPRSQ